MKEEMRKERCGIGVVVRMYEWIGNSCLGLSVGWGTPLSCLGVGR